jgi:hypothetical protein
MFDTVSPLNHILGMLAALPGLTAEQIGAPLSWNKRLSGYCTVGHMPSGPKAQGTVWRDTHYFVDLGYRCDENGAAVTQAELALAAAIDSFLRAIQADYTLGGTVKATTVDTGLADEPEYRLRAATEYREYPIILICRQYDSYNPNP